MLGRTLALLALNGFDAGMTLYATAHGAEEINPLMAILLTYGAWPFVLGKTLCFCSGTAVLWRLRQHRAARVCLNVGVFAYILLACYHLWVANSI
jgi:hypothetical protein